MYTVSITAKTVFLPSVRSRLLPSCLLDTGRKLIVHNTYISLLNVLCKFSWHPVFRGWPWWLFFPYLKYAQILWQKFFCFDIRSALLPLCAKLQINSVTTTAKTMKFSMKDFFSKFDQILSFLRIWLHLLNKSLMENFIFVQWKLCIPVLVSVKKRKLLSLWPKLPLLYL